MHTFYIAQPLSTIFEVSYRTGTPPTYIWRKSRDINFQKAVPKALKTTNQLLFVVSPGLEDYGILL